MSIAVADGMIRSFFERWQRLEEEKANIADDLKELFAEARGNGLDAKALRAVFREQVGDKVAREEFDAICDLYRASLTAPRAHPAPAHEKTLNNLASYAEATGREPTVREIEKVQPAHVDALSEVALPTTGEDTELSGLGSVPGTGSAGREGSTPSRASNSDEGIPAFLKRDRKPYREGCQHPEPGQCGAGGPGLCHACKKAMAEVEAA